MMCEWKMPTWLTEGLLPTYSDCWGVWKIYVFLLFSQASQQNEYLDDVINAKDMMV